MLKVYIDNIDLFSVYGLYVKDNGLSMGTPEVVDHSITIPGKNGKVDLYSKFWGITVGNTQHTIQLHGRYENFINLRNDFISRFHNKDCEVVIDNLPNQFWKARVTVKTNGEDDKYSNVTLNLDCEPYPFDIFSRGVINDV